MLLLDLKNGERPRNMPVSCFAQITEQLMPQINFE